VKRGAWAVGITAGSREVQGRKGLWQETTLIIIIIIIITTSPVVVSTSPLMYTAVRRFGKLGTGLTEGSVSLSMMALIARGGTCGVLEESGKVDRDYVQLKV
jgi:hypothetical protein